MVTAGGSVPAGTGLATPDIDAPYPEANRTRQG